MSRLHRVELLEKVQKRQQSGPQVIRIVAFGEAVPRTCLIVANRHGESGGVGRREGETGAAFLARVEAERLRLHGPSARSETPQDHTTDN